MDTEEWAKTLAIASGDRIGDYVVDQALGQGGTARVYAGHHYSQDARRLVSLKILNPTMLDMEVEKGRLEQRRDLAGHSCPYLVQPLPYFAAEIPSTDGPPWQTLVDVYEYVAGNALDPRQLPEDRVRPIIAMICQAARYLQARGFCHRDIKPDNIVITPGATRAVLLDLGVLHAEKVRIGDSPLTGVKSSHALVTRRYSSPETFGGLGRNSSSDDWLAHTIYQIGAIVFEAITKRQLFEDKADDKLVAAIITDDPFLGSPVTRCHEMEPVARTCLAKKPQERLAVDWDLLEWKRRARKPTIVILYCGGTIGAVINPRGLTLLPRKLGPEDPLPLRIVSRLQRDYHQVAPGSPRLSFEWRFVPNELQIFSEHSNPTVWNGIAEAVAEVLKEDWSGKYLMGIILLHGTDTLAYTASALQFAFPSLPCPLVLTGSNQPPSEERDVEQAWHASQSDAWTNILRSVLFLVDGGHRLPMVYVAFAYTICHAVNVQKTPLNRIPLRFAAGFRFVSEAFSYRNVELGRRFAYKYVEGVLLNNFRPVFEEEDYSGPPPDGPPAFWERSGLDIEAVRPVGPFSTDLSVLAVFPCSTPRPEIGGLQLVVAYPSGTVSDMIREDLGEQAMVITQWGLAPHQADYEAKAGLPELETKLFRLLPETALPLLSLAAAQQGVDVEAALVRLVTSNPVVGALLGNPLNRGHQRSRAEHVQNRARRSHERSIGETLLSLALGDSPAVLLEPDDKMGTQLPAAVVTFRRHHFEALIYGLVSPHANAGSLPDQLGALCDIGFDTGVSIAVEWSRGYSAAEGREPVEDLMKAVKLAIRASGLARVRTEVVRGWETARLRIWTRLESAQQTACTESWAFDSAADHRFLDQLAHGLPLEFTGHEDDRYFLDELSSLRDSDGLVRTTAVYWYLLGIVKGALCSILSDRADPPLEGARTIREEVVLRLLAGRKHVISSEAQLVFAQKLLDLGEDRFAPQQDSDLD